MTPAEGETQILSACYSRGTITLRTMDSKMMATIGDKSNIPNLGKTLRIGASMGSVTWCNMVTSGYNELPGLMVNHDKSTRPIIAMYRKVKSVLTILLSTAIPLTPWTSRMPL